MNHSDEVQHPSRFELEECMRSTVMKDEIDGHIYFNTYCVGDMQDDDHKDDIVIKVDRFPPGSVIIVQTPTCVYCGLEPHECNCDHHDNDIQTMPAREAKT